MPGLDWFTEEAQERQVEIYASFHPDEQPDNKSEKDNHK